MREGGRHLSLALLATEAVSKMMSYIKQPHQGPIQSWQFELWDPALTGLHTWVGGQDKVLTERRPIDRLQSKMRGSVEI